MCIRLTSYFEKLGGNVSRAETPCKNFFIYLRCWGTFTLTKESLYFCLSYRGERREVDLARARIHEVFLPLQPLPPCKTI